MDDELIISTTIHDDLALVTVVGELDAMSAFHLDDAIDALASRGIEHLILNLAGVTFMDATGLDSIMKPIVWKMQPKVTIVQAPEHVVKLMRLTGLSHH